MDQKMIDEWKQVLDYDPLTGVFTWKVDIFVGNKNSRIQVRKGDIAGCSVKPFGYIRIGYRRKYVEGQRLAWLFTHGPIDLGLVDHKDCNPANNRIDNLRLATSPENGYNAKLAKNNTSGVKGVTWNATQQKWSARVSVNGKRHTLGVFSDKNQAEAVVKAFREQHHGEYSNHGGF